MYRTVILPFAFYAFKLGPSHSATDKDSVFESRFSERYLDIRGSR